MVAPEHHQQGLDRDRGIVSGHDIVNEETALLAGAPPPSTEHEEEQERWNSPTINSYRFISVNLTLVILGLNDSCIGVSLLPRHNPAANFTSTNLSL